MYVASGTCIIAGIAGSDLLEAFRAFHLGERAAEFRQYASRAQPT
jgi:hypothetical protein